MKRQTYLRGPNILLILDADEIVQDDPGQGTPAIVEFKTKRGKDSGTFWCVNDTGFGQDGNQLTKTQSEWLARQEEFVEKFVDHFSN